jgi:hypothetical protein
MPSEHGNNAVIAPYWENLVPTGSGGSNGIAPDGVFYHHDPTAGTFTIEWSRLHHYKPQILGLQTFQVVLLDPAIHPTASGDGEMLFYYRDVVNNDNLRNYATVGIEDEEGLVGLQLSYARINDPGVAPLQPGMAIRVTTEAPLRVPFVTSGFQAQINSRHDQEAEIQAQWSLEDTRPVLGWHLELVHQDGVIRLTDTPLPPETRNWSGTLDLEAELAVSLRLKALHPYGASTQPGEVALESGTVIGLALHGASPNPMTGQTRIAFALPEAGQVRLRIFDAAGRHVRTLVDGQVSAGEGVRIWDGRDTNGSPAAGGVYFYRLETPSKTLNRKLILVR